MHAQSQPQHSLPWIFVITDVKKVILGADITHLFVSPSQRQITIHNQTTQRIQTHPLLWLHTASQPIAPRQTQRSSHISDRLSTATHVFIRHDGVRKPLQPSYDGPFPVISRTDKHFTISMHGRNDTVSIDCLKPAHLYSSSSTPVHSHTTVSSPSPSQHANIPPTTTPTSTRTTRSGRRVHFPTYLSRNV